MKVSNPSIGNWSFPCRSHYWIRNNTVQWAEEWSQEWIDAGRSYDRRAKETYFDGPAMTTEDHEPKDKPGTPEAGKVPLGLWQMVKKWWLS